MKEFSEWIDWIKICKFFAHQTRLSSVIFDMACAVAHCWDVKFKFKSLLYVFDKYSIDNSESAMSTSSVSVMIVILYYFNGCLETF